MRRMSSSTTFGFSPEEQILGSAPHTFARALAFAAHRSEQEWGNDHSPDSTRPTIPVAAQAA